MNLMMEKNPSKRYVLVVSNDSRSNDKKINILMLGDAYTGRDVVEIKDEAIGGVRFVHCGMVTYTNREYLVNEVMKLDSAVMEEVEKVIASELGICQNVAFESDFYL